MIAFTANGSNVGRFTVNDKYIAIVVTRNVSTVNLFLRLTVKIFGVNWCAYYYREVYPVTASSSIKIFLHLFSSILLLPHQDSSHEKLCKTLKVGWNDQAQTKMLFNLCLTGVDSGFSFIYACDHEQVVHLGKWMSCLLSDPCVCSQTSEIATVQTFQVARKYLAKSCFNIKENDLERDQQFFPVVVL